jgi:hypothetical protein
MVNVKAVYLEEHLHHRLKVLATRRRRPLKAVLESLLERALSDESPSGDVTTAEMQTLAARGGSFDFLSDDREGIYTLVDGEPIE